MSKINHLFLRSVSALLVVSLLPGVASAQTAEEQREDSSMRIVLTAGGIFTAAPGLIMSISGVNDLLNNPTPGGREAGAGLLVGGLASAALSAVLFGVLIDLLSHGTDRYVLPVADVRASLEGAFFRNDGTFRSMSLPMCRGLGISDCADAVHSWEDDLPYLNRAISEFRRTQADALSRLLGPVSSPQSTSARERLTLREQRALGAAFERFITEELVGYVSDSSLRILQAIGRIVLGAARDAAGAGPSAALRLGDSPVELRPNGVAITF